MSETGKRDGSAEAGDERPRSREQTRARLLEAAAQVFAEVGLAGASVEAVCERAGFTRGAFYSNFASKDEMFLQLAVGFARERVEVVRGRVAEMVDTGEIHRAPAETADLVRVLAGEVDDRLGVLLMNEIRIRAMRDDALAADYLAEEERMTAEIAQLIGDIARVKGFTLRLSAEDAARTVLAAWEAASARATIARVSDEKLARLRADAVVRLAELIIAEA